ncbi:MAG: peptidoglycan DD-metalloendopeptidase family protein [Casimicrobiaceae bacterium]
MNSAHRSYLFPRFLASPLVVAGLLVALVAGCSSRMPAPVEDRPVIRGPGSRMGAAAPSVPALPSAPGPVSRLPGAATEPETPRPQAYTVKRGDTLHLIALDHGLDYRELAAWNNIENVNRIFVGQVLRLAPPGEMAGAVAGAAAGPGGVTTAPLRTVPPVVAGAGNMAPAPAAAAPAAADIRPPVVASRNSETYKTQPKAVKEPYSEQALRDLQRAPPAVPASPSGTASAVPPPSVATPEPPPSPGVVARNEPKPKPDPKPDVRSTPPVAGDDDDDKFDWMWPATGKLVTGFSDTANLKGIDIAGKNGQPVVASAAGKVVYAGTGLRGYGKLIIIKHNKNYLSAYAHNKDIVVKEGQQVTRGQKIAEMGNSDADQVKLHFEIRRLGKPMDPLKFLPPA